jgi:hypothetical protein
MSEVSSGLRALEMQELQAWHRERARRENLGVMGERPRKRLLGRRGGRPPA